MLLAVSRGNFGVLGSGPVVTIADGDVTFPRSCVVAHEGWWGIYPSYLRCRGREMSVIIHAAKEEKTVGFGVEGMDCTRWGGWVSSGGVSVSRDVTGSWCTLLGGG